MLCCPLQIRNFTLLCLSRPSEPIKMLGVGNPTIDYITSRGKQYVLSQVVLLKPELSANTNKLWPQHSNAMCMHNMTRFAAGKLLGNSRNCFKKSKDKAVPGKRNFKH